MSILRAKPVSSRLRFCFLPVAKPNSGGIQNAKIAMAQRIAAEPAGDYYIGRRLFLSRTSSFGATSATESG